MGRNEYVPAYYTNVLNEMLSRGARPGQGGHLEGNTEEVSRAFGWLESSPFLFAEVADVLGLHRGDAIVRSAVARMGQYRGTEIRRHVESLGLPLDAERLDRYWDFAADEVVSRSYSAQEPHYVAFAVHGCAFHDHMKLVCPQRLAVSMCEIAHQAIAREFNPAISVWYPALLSRGEAKCEFRFSMPREAAEKAAREAEKGPESSRTGDKPVVEGQLAGKSAASASYRSLARMVVTYYHYVADELLRSVGEEQTQAILRRAMRTWGSWRGKAMREDHQKRGWDLNVQNLITYYDDPAAGVAWTAENVLLSPIEHTKDITDSPYSAMFAALGTGRFAVPFFEETVPAQAEAYNPLIEVTIPKLMERGDLFSRFCYRMASPREQSGYHRD